MDDVVDVGVLLEHLVKRGLILDVELVELGLLAADELNAVDDLLGRVIEVVDDDDLVASLEECKRRERPDVASATGSC